MASLVHFTLMAGTASAALLALSNFQGLTTSVPVQCLYAYNMPIQRCTPADFTVGGSCSQSCIAGLQAAQFTVRGLCFSVNAPANSLLKQIQDGHIVDVLCGPNKAPIPITTASAAPPKQTPSKPAPPPNPESTPGMAPRPIFSTLSTSIDPTQATTSAALPEATQSATTSEASSTSSESLGSTTSEEVPSSTTTSIAETPTNPAQPSDNDQPSSSTTTTTKSKPTRPPNSQPGSGGGSPFDFVPASRATKLGLAGGSLAIVIAIASTTLGLL